MQDLIQTVSDLETYNVVVVSTGHFPYRDMETLEEKDSNPLIVIPTEYGFLVYCNNIDEAGQVQAILDFGYTTALTDWLQLGYAKGCTYINIDQDGPVYDGVACFDW